MVIISGARGVVMINTLSGITTSDVSVVSDAFDHHHHFHVRISE